MNQPNADFQRADRKKLIFRAFLSALIVFSAGGCLLFLGKFFPEKAEQTATLSFSGKEYTLEVSRSEAERAKGLSEREDLCTGCGMLFVFEKPGRYSFWMRGMRFPLDIIWLDGEKVVWIERRVPAESEKIMVSDVPADAVVELPAGEADGLERGDEVVLQGRFRP
ncbi:MAG: hypothetical protein A2808_01330 [Candidatus Moranbacteria bacterium RIFCSPHIGHO2_01_FULL_55_24]|nr:MAG: hypothetical protein A2808_01330 [Candidatus Moranbacteria bacterium RIFCSPHIGHO2_01_FULL_55_24]